MAGTPEQHIWILRDQLTSCNNALEEVTVEKTELTIERDQLKADVRSQKEAYVKLEKHVKACEKATTQAQKEAELAKGSATHQVNSQKGQLKNAERRFTDASRDLKEWTGRYGSDVEKPAKDVHDLRERLSELQAGAELARNQIASLEAQVQGTPEQIGLHQALEQWEEHQGCSAEFRDLEDKVHDGIADKQKLEADLKASKERCQKTKKDLNGVQNKLKQLQQTNNALLKVQSNPDQLQQVLKDFQELQVKVDELEQTNKALQGQDKTQEHTLQVQKLESEIKASTEKTHEYMLYVQKLESDIKASTEKNHDYFLYIQQLESDIKTSREETEIAQAEWRDLEDQIAAQLAKDDRGLSGFADNVDDVEMLDRDLLEKERMESELRALQVRFQKTESDFNALQVHYQQTESDLNALRVHYQKAESDMNALQVRNQKAQLDLNTLGVRNQKTESDLHAVQGRAHELEEVNQAFQDQQKGLTDMLQQLQSDQQQSQQRSQENESSQQELQQKANQLESELKSMKEQYQTTKAEMDALQEYANRLKLDLNAANEQYETSKSSEEDLQGKRVQLEQGNKALREKGAKVESDLKTTKEQYQLAKSKIDALQGQSKKLESDLKDSRAQHQKAKSDMEELKGKANQLEQANASQEEENKRLQTEITEKQAQYEKEKQEIAEAEQRSMLRVKTPEQAERSRVTPLSSPVYTTDEGSQDLEKTPRPKKSLRQDLGYSSREHSDKEQPDVHMPQPQNPVMSEQAKLLRDLNNGTANFGDSDDEEARERTKGVSAREMKRLLTKARYEKDRAIREMREKEVSETLKNIFECTPEKAKAIDRRLQIIGPGALVGEAPAVIAYELSGIPVDTYKGLASGQLIATMPPNEVRDMGTNPEVFADDVTTQITDLRTVRVADPRSVTQDMGTDTADLPVEEITTYHNRFSRQALFNHFMMLLMMLFALFCFYRSYIELFSDPSSETQNGTQYQTVYIHRHTPVPTPSVNYSTPITLVYPPTPAPQLGLVRMMMGSSLGRGLGGSKW